MSSKKDQEDRLRDQWWEVELFRIVNGRLPNKEGDELTKSMAKEYLDRFLWNNEKLPETLAKKHQLTKYAFHVYAKTNLAYKDDL